MQVARYSNKFAISSSTTTCTTMTATVNFVVRPTSKLSTLCFRENLACGVCQQLFPLHGRYVVQKSQPAVFACLRIVFTAFGRCVLQEASPWLQIGALPPLHGRCRLCRKAALSGLSACKLLRVRCALQGAGLRGFQPANYLHYMNTVLYREDRLYVCPIEQIVFIAWLAIVLYREAILWLPCTWPPMHRRCCDLQKS